MAGITLDININDNQAKRSLSDITSAIEGIKQKADVAFPEAADYFSMAQRSVEASYERAAKIDRELNDVATPDYRKELLVQEKGMIVSSIEAMFSDLSEVQALTSRLAREFSGKKNKASAASLKSAMPDLLSEVSNLHRLAKGIDYLYEDSEIMSHLRGNKSTKTILDRLNVAQRSNVESDLLKYLAIVGSPQVKRGSYINRMSKGAEVAEHMFGSFEEMLPSAFVGYHQSKASKSMLSTQATDLSADERKIVRNLLNNNAYFARAAESAGIAKRSNGRMQLLQNLTRENINEAAAALYDTFVQSAKGMPMYGLTDVNDPDKWQNIARKTNKPFLGSLNAGRVLSDRFGWLDPQRYAKGSQVFSSRPRAYDRGDAINTDPIINRYEVARYTLEDMKAKRNLNGSQRDYGENPEDHYFAVDDSIHMRNIFSHRPTNRTVRNNEAIDDIFYLALDERFKDPNLKPELREQLINEYAEQLSKSHFRKNGRKNNEYVWSGKISPHLGAEFMLKERRDAILRDDPWYFSAGLEGRDRNNPLDIAFVDRVDSKGKKHTGYQDMAGTREYMLKDNTTSQDIRELYGSDFPTADKLKVKVVDMEEAAKSGLGVGAGLNGSSYINSKYVQKGFQARMHGLKGVLNPINFQALSQRYNGGIILPGAGDGEFVTIDGDEDLVINLADLKNAGLKFEGMNSSQIADIVAKQYFAPYGIGVSRTADQANKSRRWISGQMAQFLKNDQALSQMSTDAFMKLYQDVGTPMGALQHVFGGSSEMRDILLDSSGAGFQSRLVQERIDEFRNNMIARIGKGDLLLPEELSAQTAMGAPWIFNAINRSMEKMTGAQYQAELFNQRYASAQTDVQKKAVYDTARKYGFSLKGDRFTFDRNPNQALDFQKRYDAAGTKAERDLILDQAGEAFLKRTQSGEFVERTGLDELFSRLTDEQKQVLGMADLSDSEVLFQQSAMNSLGISRFPATSRSAQTVRNAIVDQRSQKAIQEERRRAAYYQQLHEAAQSVTEKADVTQRANKAGFVFDGEKYVSRTQRKHDVLQGLMKDLDLDASQVYIGTDSPLMEWLQGADYDGDVFELFDLMTRDIKQNDNTPKAVLGRAFVVAQKQMNEYYKKFGFTPEKLEQRKSQMVQDLFTGKSSYNLQDPKDAMRFAALYQLNSSSMGGPNAVLRNAAQMSMTKEIVQAMADAEAQYDVNSTQGKKAKFIESTGKQKEIMSKYKPFTEFFNMVDKSRDDTGRINYNDLQKRAREDATGMWAINAPFETMSANVRSMLTSRYYAKQKGWDINANYNWNEIFDTIYGKEDKSTALGRMQSSVRDIQKGFLNADYLFLSNDSAIQAAALRQQAIDEEKRVASKLATTDRAAFEARYGSGSTKNFDRLITNYVDRRGGNMIKNLPKYGMVESNMDKGVNSAYVSAMQNLGLGGGLIGRFDWAEQMIGQTDLSKTISDVKKANKSLYDVDLLAQWNKMSLDQKKQRIDRLGGSGGRLSYSTISEAATNPYKFLQRLIDPNFKDETHGGTEIGQSLHSAAAYFMRQRKANPNATADELASWRDQAIAVFRHELGLPETDEDLKNRPSQWPESEKTHRRLNPTERKNLMENPNHVYYQEYQAASRWLREDLTKIFPQDKYEILGVESEDNITKNKGGRMPIQNMGKKLTTDEDVGMTGAYDLLVRNKETGKIEIGDYKLYTKPSTEDFIHFDKQQKIYAQAVSDAGAAVEAYNIILPLQGMLKNFEIGDRDIAENTEHFRAAIASIQKMFGSDQDITPVDMLNFREDLYTLIYGGRNPKSSSFGSQIHGKNTTSAVSGSTITGAMLMHDEYNKALEDLDDVRKFARSEIRDENARFARTDMWAFKRQQIADAKIRAQSQLEAGNEAEYAKINAEAEDAEARLFEAFAGNDRRGIKGAAARSYDKLGENMNRILSAGKTTQQANGIVNLQRSIAEQRRIAEEDYEETVTQLAESTARANDLKRQMKEKGALIDRPTDPTMAIGSLARQQDVINALLGFSTEIETNTKKGRQGRTRFLNQDDNLDYIKQNLPEVYKYIDENKGTFKTDKEFDLTSVLAKEKKRIDTEVEHESKETLRLGLELGKEKDREKKLIHAKQEADEARRLQSGVLRDYNNFIQNKTKTFASDTLASLRGETVANNGSLREDMLNRVQDIRSAQQSFRSLAENGAFGENGLQSGYYRQISDELEQMLSPEGLTQYRKKAAADRVKNYEASKITWGDLSTSEKASADLQAAARRKQELVNQEIANISRDLKSGSFSTEQKAALESLKSYYEGFSSSEYITSLIGQKQAELGITQKSSTQKIDDWLNERLPYVDGSLQAGLALQAKREAGDALTQASATGNADQISNAAKAYAKADKDYQDALANQENSQEQVDALRRRAERMKVDAINQEVSASQRSAMNLVSEVTGEPVDSQTYAIWQANEIRNKVRSRIGELPDLINNETDPTIKGQYQQELAQLNALNTSDLQNRLLGLAQSSDNLRDMGNASKLRSLIQTFGGSVNKSLEDMVADAVDNARSQVEKYIQANPQMSSAEQAAFRAQFENVDAIRNRVTEAFYRQQDDEALGLRKKSLDLLSRTSEGVISPQDRINLMVDTAQHDAARLMHDLEERMTSPDTSWDQLNQMMEQYNRIASIDWDKYRGVLEDDERYQSYAARDTHARNVQGLIDKTSGVPLSFDEQLARRRADYDRSIEDEKQRLRMDRRAGRYAGSMDEYYQRMNDLNMIDLDAWERSQRSQYANQQGFMDLQNEHQLLNIQDQSEARLHQMERQFQNAQRQQAMRYSGSRIVNAIYGVQQRREAAQDQYDNINRQIRAEERVRDEAKYKMDHAVTPEDYKKASNAYAQSEEKLSGLSSTAKLAKEQLDQLNGAGTMGQAVFASFWQSVNMLMQRFGRQMFQKALQEAKRFVKEFDQTMTTIQMITLKSDSQINTLGDSLIKKAKELKISVSEISQSAATLYRQGLSDEEVNERLDVISKFSKVSGTKIDAATKLITIAMNTGLVTDPQIAADIVTALGDNAATNAAEIEKGIEKAGAAAAADGTTFAQLASMLTAITSTTQIGGNVAGRTINTIIGRMNKIGTNELIYDENGNAISGSAVAKLLAAQGINMYDEQGNKRSTYDTLYALSQRWETMSDAEQQQIANAIAGTRQYSNFSAIMQGMSEGKVDQYMALTESSEGITDKKFDIYTKSLQASLTDLKNTFDELVNDLTSSGVITGFVKNITSMIQGVDNLTKSFGGLSAVVSTVLPMLIGMMMLKFGMASGNVGALAVGVGALAVGALTANSASGMNTTTDAERYQNSLSLINERYLSATEKIERAKVLQEKGNNRTQDEVKEYTSLISSLAQMFDLSDPTKNVNDFTDSLNSVSAAAANAARHSEEYAEVISESEEAAETERIKALAGKSSTWASSSASNLTELRSAQSRSAVADSPYLAPFFTEDEEGNLTVDPERFKAISRLGMSNDENANQIQLGIGAMLSDWESVPGLGHFIDWASPGLRKLVGKNQDVMQYSFTNTRPLLAQLLSDSMSSVSIMNPELFDQLVEEGFAGYSQADWFDYLGDMHAKKDVSSLPLQMLAVALENWDGLNSIAESSKAQIREDFTSELKQFLPDATEEQIKLMAAQAAEDVVGLEGQGLDINAAYGKVLDNILGLSSGDYNPEALKEAADKYSIIAGYVQPEVEHTYAGKAYKSYDLAKKQQDRDYEDFLNKNGISTVSYIPYDEGYFKVGEDEANLEEMRELHKNRYVERELEQFLTDSYMTGNMLNGEFVPSDIIDGEFAAFRAANKVVSKDKFTYFDRTGTPTTYDNINDADKARYNDYISRASDAAAAAGVLGSLASSDPNEFTENLLAWYEQQTQKVYDDFALENRIVPGTSFVYNGTEYASEKAANDQMLLDFWQPYGEEQGRYIIGGKEYSSKAEAIKAATPILEQQWEEANQIREAIDHFEYGGFEYDTYEQAVEQRRKDFYEAQENAIARATQEEVDLLDPFHAGTEQGYATWRDDKKNAYALRADEFVRSMQKAGISDMASLRGFITEDNILDWKYLTENNGELARLVNSVQYDAEGNIINPEVYDQIINTLYANGRDRGATILSSREKAQVAQGMLSSLQNGENGYLSWEAALQDAQLEQQKEIDAYEASIQAQVDAKVATLTGFNTLPLEEQEQRRLEYEKAFRLQAGFKARTPEEIAAGYKVYTEDEQKYLKEALGSDLLYQSILEGTASEEVNNYARTLLANKAAGVSSLTAKDRLAGIKEIRAVAEEYGLQNYNEEVAAQYLSGWANRERYFALQSKEGLSQEEVAELEALQTEFDNLQKSAEIEVELEGIKALEEAGEIASGTAASLEKLKKGGKFAIDVMINYRSESFEAGQQRAKLFKGTRTEQNEAAMAALNMSRDEYFLDEEGNLKAAQQNDIYAQTEESNTLMQWYKAQNNVEGQQNIIDYAKMRGFKWDNGRFVFDESLLSVSNVSPFAGAEQSYSNLDIANARLSMIQNKTTASNETISKELFEQASSGLGFYGNEYLRQIEAGMTPSKELEDLALAEAQEAQRQAEEEDALERARLGSNTIGGAFSYARQKYNQANKAQLAANNLYEAFSDVDPDDIDKVMGIMSNESYQRDWQDLLESAPELTKEFQDAGIAIGEDGEIDWSAIQAQEDGLSNALADLIRIIAGHSSDLEGVIYDTRSDIYTNAQNYLVNGNNDDYDDYASIVGSDLAARRRAKDYELTNDELNYEQMLLDNYQKGIDGLTQSQQLQGAQQILSSMQDRTFEQRFGQASPDMVNAYIGAADGMNELVEAYKSGELEAEDFAKMQKDVSAALLAASYASANYGDTVDEVSDSLNKLAKGGKTARQELIRIREAAYDTQDKMTAWDEAFNGGKVKSGSQMSKEGREAIAKQTGVAADTIKKWTAEEMAANFANEGTQDDINDEMNTYVESLLNDALNDIRTEYGQDFDLKEQIDIGGTVDIICNPDGSINMEGLIALANAAQSDAIGVLEALAQGKLAEWVATLKTSGEGESFKAWIEAQTKTLAKGKGGGGGGSRYNNRGGGGGGGGGKSAADELIERQKHDIAALEHQVKMSQIASEHLDLMNDYEGYNASLEEQIRLQNELRAAYAAQIAELQAMMASVEAGSDDWYKLRDAIFAAEEAMRQATNDIDSLNQKRIDSLSKKQENEKKPKTHKETMLSKLLDKYGMVQDYVNYENIQKEQIKNYKSQIKQNNKHIDEQERLLGSLVKGSQQWIEVRDKIWKLKEENAELENSILQAEIEIERTKLTSIATKLEHALDPYEHHTNILGIHGDMYQRTYNYQGYRHTLRQQNDSNQQKVAATQAAIDAVKKQMETLEEGSVAWYEARQALYAYEESLAQLNATILENEQAIGQSKVDELADKYNEATQHLNHELNMLNSIGDEFKKEGNLGKYQKVLQDKIDVTNESIENQIAAIQEMKDALKDPEITDSAYRDLVAQIEAAEEALRNSQNSAADLKRELNQLKLDRLNEVFNYGNTKRHGDIDIQHNIQMYQYEETKYKNNGELTNYGHVLEQENALHEERARNIQDHINNLKEQKNTIEDDVEAVKKIEEEIRKWEQELAKENNTIAQNTKLIEQNQVAILKTRQAVENAIEQEIRNRINREKEMLAATVSLENQIIDVIRKNKKEEWDLEKKTIQKKKEALNEEKNLLNERLQARKDAINTEEKYEEIARLKKQLAIIQADATRTKEAKELAKRLADLEKEVAWQIADEQAAATARMYDDQISSLDDYIGRQEEALEEYLKDANNFKEEVNKVLSGTVLDFLDFMHQNNESYKNATLKAQQQMDEQWTDTFMKMRGEILTYWNEVEEHMRSREDFIEYMKKSVEYEKASETGREILEKSWGDIYDAFVNAYKDDNVTLSFEESSTREILAKMDDMKDWVFKVDFPTTKDTKLDLSHLLDYLYMDVDNAIIPYVPDTDYKNIGLDKAPDPPAPAPSPEPEPPPSGGGTPTTTPTPKVTPSKHGYRFTFFGTPYQNEGYSSKADAANASSAVLSDLITGNRLTNIKKQAAMAEYSSSLYVYKQGGLADYTGFAWVDGTKSRPEAFLNADDTALLRSMLDAFNLVKAPTMSHIDTSKYVNNMTVGDVNVTINEAQINKDQDISDLAKRIGKAFSKELTNSGMNLSAYNW